MSVNLSTSTSHTSYTPAPIAANDPDQIEKDAAKNCVNLAATPAPEVNNVNNTLGTLYKVGKAAEKAIEEKPQSLFSKMVQWFNRVILRNDNASQTSDNAQNGYKDNSELPLEKPRTVTAEMMDDFLTFAQKFTKLKSDALDEIRDEKDLYKLLMKSGIRHHRRNNELRLLDGQSILSSTKQATTLKTEQKELNLSKMSVEQKQKFWNRVNLGLSTAMTLLTIAGYLTGRASINSPFGMLSALGAVTMGSGQMISAGIKKSSETLAGESKALEEELSSLRTMTESELKIFNASFDALLKLFTHLAEINQKHYRVNTMALSDR